MYFMRESNSLTNQEQSNQLYTLKHNYLIIKNIINQFFVIFNIEYERKFLTLYKYGLLLIL